MVRLLCLLADFLNGRDDVGVGSAAADVAAHQLLYVSVGGAALLLEKGDGGHDLARGTVTALVAVVFHERCLHGVQVSGLAESFDGGDLVPFVHDGQRQTGVDAAAVHVDGAGSALAVVATFLGAGQTDGLAQAVEQRSTRIDVEIELFSVNPKGHWNSPFDGFRGRLDSGNRRRRSDHGSGGCDHAGYAERGKEGAAAEVPYR